MAKNKIDDIEVQIEKLKKKKADLITKREKEIGSYLIKTWGMSDKSDEEIFELINKYNPNKNNNFSNEETENNTNSNTAV